MTEVRQENRHTGRTQRMLDYAVEQAKSAHYVVIFTNSQKHSEALFERLAALDVSGANQRQTKVWWDLPDEVQGIITLVPRNWESANLKGGFLKGYADGIIYLIDHHAAQEFLNEHWVYRELHRWDASVVEVSDNMPNGPFG